MLTDPDEVASEQERFLLRELVALFESDGLLRVHDTVIVAARHAYPEYFNLDAYVCQLNRLIRPGLRHLGFYTSKEIKAEIPAILARHTAVTSTEEQARLSEHEGNKRLAEIIRTALAISTREHGQAYDVYELSSAEAEDTVQLPKPLPHVGEGAWAQHQRYARSEDLQTAKSTTDLLRENGTVPE